MNIFLILIYLFTPAILITLTNRFLVLKKIGPVLMAYIVGLLLGHAGLQEYIPNLAQIQETLNSISIPLALPLLLLSIQIRHIRHMAKTTIKALTTGLLSVIVFVTLGYLLFHTKLTDGWKIAGMLVGVYSGGTPNLASIQSALQVDAETFVMVNTVDMLISTLFLFFFLSFGKILLRRFLPTIKQYKPEDVGSNQVENMEDYKNIFTLKGLQNLFGGVGISLLIVLVSAGISFLLVQKISMLILILSITTLSILAAANRKINGIKYTFQSGMYLILIFCIVVASMANLKEMGQIAGGLLAYLAFVVFGSLSLHIILAKIFRIDADTLMISSTALICSPPFVPVVAGNLKNKNVLLIGLTVGVIGYAIGNYLGITLAHILKLLAL